MANRETFKIEIFKGPKANKFSPVLNVDDVVLAGLNFPMRNLFTRNAESKMSELLENGSRRRQKMDRYRNPKS